MHPTEDFTAVAADDYLSEAVVAAEGSGLSVRAGVESLELLLWVFLFYIESSCHKNLQI